MPTRTLNFVVELSGRDAFGRETTIATVKAPRLLPRIIALPRSAAGVDNQFVLLSSVIHAHLPELFGGREIVGYSQFRVTRDADLWFDEEEVKNLRQALEGELPQRHFGLAVRLEVAADARRSPRSSCSGSSTQPTTTCIDARAPSTWRGCRR